VRRLSYRVTSGLRCIRAAMAPSQNERRDRHKIGVLGGEAPSTCAAGGSAMSETTALHPSRASSTRDGGRTTQMARTCAVRSLGFRV
jgi:hypothetical protein